MIPEKTKKIKPEVLDQCLHLGSGLYSKQNYNLQEVRRDIKLNDINKI